MNDVIARHWDEDIVPRLVEYIRVPAKSPHFDPDWEKHGHIEKVTRDAERWVKAQGVAGLACEIVRLAGRTPLLYFDAPARGPSTRAVAIYGHLDKQPEMTGWRPDGGPWTPIYEDGRLYGRGGADDGYSVYAAIAAIKALDAQGTPRPRCVGLIETCEESGSYDLPAYLDALAPRMGGGQPPSGTGSNIALVIALDSGAGNYDQLWATTSLRGIVNGTLTVAILTEGVHSGDAGGVVPSSFRIARQLLDRIDDSRTGLVAHPAFNCTIPPERIEQAKQAAGVLGDALWKRFPFVGSPSASEEGKPVTSDLVELVLNRTWRAALEVIGAEGLPPLEAAGNVLRPETKLKLSLRLPPLVNGDMAAEELKKILGADPPYGAHVSFDYDNAGTGWNAPATEPWLAKALDEASGALFGRPAGYMGEGGTIPFMSMLGAKFPHAQILVTGVLGPKSNAHGPNEFLHVPYAKKVTAAVAAIVAALPA
jgi:acetylornithine deacetylase/succinyl-diaminopimelate desuccinylase-like protein